MNVLVETVTHISPDCSWLNMDTTLTRRSPVLPSRWVWDSGIAWALWTLNPQHLGCRTLFLSCFCSWWNPRSLFSVHPKMSSAHTHTQRHAFKYFLVPGRHHNSCWAEKPKKNRKSHAKEKFPAQERKDEEVRRKDTAEFHTWGERCGSLSLRLSKRTRMEDLISSAVVAEQQATGRSTPSYETRLSEWLCHTGKPSLVIIPASLERSPGLQPSSTSRSSTGTC